MPNNLESHIQSIAIKAAAEIAAAVRSSIAEEVNRLLRGGGAVTAVAAPKKVPQAQAQATTAATTHAMPKAAKAAKPTGRKRRRTGISPAHMEQIYNVIKAKPGLTSLQIQAESGVSKDDAARVLTKLRESSAVKVKGARSKMTYSV